MGFDGFTLIQDLGDFGCKVCQKWAFFNLHTFCVARNVRFTEALVITRDFGMRDVSR